MAYQVELNHEPGCFVTLPRTALVLAAGVARPTFSCTTADGRTVYVTCAGWTARDGCVTMSVQLARCLKLSAGDELVLSLVSPPSCRSAQLRAASSTDYKLLQLTAARLTDSMLNLTGCVWSGGELPVWIDRRNSLSVRVESVEPVSSSCVLLVRLSELTILPPRVSSVWSPAELWRSPPALSDNEPAPRHGPHLLRVHPSRAWSGPASVASLLTQRVCVCLSTDAPELISGSPSWYWASGLSGEARCLVLLMAVDLESAVTELNSCLSSTYSGVDEELCVQPGSVLVPDVIRRQLRLCVSDSVSLSPASELAMSAHQKRDHQLSYVSQLFCVHPVQRLTGSQLESTRHQLAAWCRLLADTRSGGLAFSSGCLLRITDEQTLEEFGLVLEAEQDVFLVKNPLQLELVSRCVSSAQDSSDGAVSWPPALHELRLPGEFSPGSVSSTSGVSVGLCPAPEQLQSQMLSWLRLALRSGGFGHLMLTGVAGVGKSSLLRSICFSLASAPSCVFSTVVPCRSLMGKRHESIAERLSKVMSEAIDRQPSLVVLDDLDHLLQDDAGDAADQWSQRRSHIQQVSLTVHDHLAALTRRQHRVAVVVSGAADLDFSLGIHMSQRFVLPSPDRVERTRILASLSGVSAENCQEAARLTEGFVLRDLCRLVTRARTGGNQLICGRRLAAAAPSITPASRQDVTAVDARRRLAPAVTWLQVGGLDEVRRTVLETLQQPLMYPTLYRRAGRHQQPRLLLYGPPGCGKTLLARALAHETADQVTFFTVNGPELLSKYIGASEAAVRDLFDKAWRSAPAVVFFDEFESLAPRRGHDSTGVTDRVVNQLLTLLDGAESGSGASGSVAVLAASSRPDLLDPALLRPGRMGRTVLCPDPGTVAARCRILTALTADLTLDPDVCLSRLAAASMPHRLTGADLRALVSDARIRAVHEMIDDHAIDGGTIAAAYGSTGMVQVAGPALTDDQWKTVRTQTTALIATPAADSPVSAANASCGGLVLCRRHLEASLEGLRPSVSVDQWRLYDSLSQRFSGSSRRDNSVTSAGVRQRITLA